ncbi:S-layer homology domain-containing protein [Flavonifractor sp. An306]|uniref:S-layer homology domain-containing protein n=1 Tax=Flavonifractor sp. An306 TaxID=1965629 RepID=UPI0013A633F5|nr:S-layer homology domain-containing protein [Flavonifractor sp. An306]
MRQKLLSVVTCLALCLTLLPAAALAADGPVTYLQRGWNGSAVTEELRTVETYTTIDSGTTQWSDGWYVASGQVTIDRSGEPDPDDRCVSVTGDVYLILADACVLTIKAAINLEQGASLTIYGQSGDSGELNALIASEGIATSLTLCGGNVSATADTIDCAIGGTVDENSGGYIGNLSIYGGAVTATSDSGVAIFTGKGYGSVNIYGGTVFAASTFGAAIGGGGTFSMDNSICNGGDGGTANIRGGTVFATSTAGAAIGGGSGANGGSDGGPGSCSIGPGALVFASGGLADIQDTSQQDAWQGTVFQGESGQVYGGTVLTSDLTLPISKTISSTTHTFADTITVGQDQSLTIPQGVTLTLEDGSTLDNTGPVFIYGSLIEAGGTVTNPGNLRYMATGVTLDKTSLTLAPGETAELTYAITPDTATDKRVTWSSDNQAVATVADGVVTAVAPGSATITATAADGSGTTASCAVTVTAPPSSGGGWWGGSTPVYAVSLADAEHGVVTVTPRSAAKGGTVTVTATPHQGYELASLTAATSKGTEVELIHQGDGSYTFSMPADDVTVSAVFRLTLPFADVPNDAWYADGVRYIYGRGLMTGTAADAFDPQLTTSRAMVAAILWRSVGSPQASYAMDFADVPLGQWYTEAIRWAARDGIVSGYGNGAFGPGDPITREQLAVMLYRYAQDRGYDLSNGTDSGLTSYTDADDVSPWALQAMEWACGAGLITGTGDGSTLSPQGEATRSQAAALLMRFGQAYPDW